MRRESFQDAAAGLRSAHQSGGSLCRPFVNAIPGSRAALSTLGASFGSETLCASDAAAERLDELQIDLGEGPSWAAVQMRRPVLESDVHRSPSPWPIFSEAASELSTQAVFAFPLAVGTVDLGALGLYADDRSTLREDDVDALVSLAGIAATQVLRTSFARFNAPIDDSYSRREVHQATGMVVAQLEVSAAEALLILRAHAYAAGVSVRAIAADIVTRRIDLSEG